MNGVVTAPELAEARILGERILADDDVFEEAAAAPRAKSEGVIAAYNASVTVAALLEQYGYRRKPRSLVDWRSPYQQSDSYATRVFDSGRFVTLSASDIAAGVGRPAKGGSAACGDAFDMFCHYEHRGDVSRAMRAAAKALGLDTHKPRDEWADAKPAGDASDEWADAKPAGDASEARGGGLPLKFWSDLGTISPPDKLVRRLLGTSSLAVLFGEPGCGKSFLAADMGLHIALGWPWFGRSVTAGAVLYVAGEGFAGLNNRLAGFKLKHQPGEEVPFAIVPVAIDLGPGGRDAERVIAAAATVKSRTGLAVQLIVVDTLARSMGGGDENSTQDMGLFVAACDRIRQTTGATVLVVHHRGKSSTAGARGSSALLGAADTVIEVEKHDAGRVAKVTKQKDGADGQKIGFDLDVIDLGEDDEGEPINTCIVRPTESVAKAAPKLSATEKRAVEVLHNTICDHPVTLGNYRDSLGNSVTPPNVTATKTDLFREGLKSAGVTERDNPAAERVAWHRLKTNLCNKGVLTIKDDLCWPALRNVT
jgi:hypothetical protein